ncbi:MAG: precorrin-2 C(20)-methyltransferase [Smithellaceae bacterium]
MKTGTLYGIGVGPGDPELVTVKAARILSSCGHVFVPKARIKAESVALTIARRYISKNARIHELTCPMTKDSAELARRWKDNGREVASILSSGEDAAFLTLGDLFLYSTYIYLLKELKKLMPQAEIVSVPGVTAFSLASALTAFPVGEGSEPIMVIPAAVTDINVIREAFTKPGTVILMKIDKRLPEIINIMEETGVIERAVMVSRAGMEDQRIETDLRVLQNCEPQTGYLSIILIHT